MYTIGKLAKDFNLSRSTLLYYDKIGLLKPSVRKENNYRYYSEKDKDRLEQIVLHRKTGVPLENIAQIIDSVGDNIEDILTSRVRAIQENIIELKKQESMILSVLIEKINNSDRSIFTKDTWSLLLSEAGYSSTDMLDWHIKFEQDAPKEHKKFLNAIGIKDSTHKDFINSIMKKK